MSERKVLNKYYPPDFDPTKLPKLKRDKNRQFVIRIMAPFSMRCTTCGEYIYKGRKFNSRMETVQNETYLGLRIYRFYIRCTKCISEITFKTDPENSDYIMEQGATRNFEAVRRLGQMLEMEKEARAEEEANNPMKALENRTRDSKREMDSMEKLEELRDLNQRAAAIDPEKLIEDHLREEEKLLKQQEDEDEKLVRQLFGSGGDGNYVKRIIDDGSDGDDDDGGGVGGSGGSGGGDDTKRKKSSKKKKKDVTDVLTDVDVPSGEVAGPSFKPAAKTKLRTPFDDLSSMVRLKKKKRNESSEEIKNVEKNVEDVGANKIVKKKVPEKKVDEPITALPAYKINLKKISQDNVTMKGTSLNLLGGYDSGSGSSDPDT